jgi:hypothetical protein
MGLFGSSKPKKKAVTCPSCNHEQMEYAAALSTTCRACGHYFKLKTGPKKTRPKRKKIARRTLVCYHCGESLSIPVEALSWQCTHCSSYLEITDRLVEGEVSSPIRTYGRLTIAAGGHYTGNRAEAGSVLLSGRSSGRLLCQELLTVRGTGLLTAIASGQRLLIETGASLTTDQPLHFREGTIEGTLAAKTLVVDGLLQIGPAARIKAERIVFGRVTAEQGCRVQARFTSRRLPEVTALDWLRSQDLSEKDVSA